ncbi:MAG: hypothetical protein U0165_14865 [Polyangiaceae bacterium]
MVRDIRASLPKAQVSLCEPTSASDASKSTQAFEGFGSTLHAQSGASPLAQYYLFTRHIFDGVNLGTAWVLGTVQLIIAYPPTSVENKTATWGPASDAENPSEWKLVVTKETDGSYSYAFEGRRKGSNDAFRPTLQGTAKGKTGQFVLDYTAANELDPARLGADTESGQTAVDYDLSQYPTTITASARPDSDAYFDVTVTRQQGGGGTVDITAHDDLDATKNTALEDVTMKSRWVASGEGRADVTVSGGDMPTPPGTVTVTECWGATFERSYYTDSVGLAATEGDAAQCPFSSAP